MKLWKCFPQDYVWSKFHQKLDICKNVNPLEVLVYDKYFYNHFCRGNGFLLDGILWKLKPSWDGVSDRFVQPIAEQLTILMIFTLIFITQTFDYVVFKRKSNLHELTKITIHQCYYIKWITSERSRFRTENGFWMLWRQTYYYFRSARRFLLLENQRGILHALLSGKDKITVNRIFNFISTKKLC